MQHLPIFILLLFFSLTRFVYAQSTCDYIIKNNVNYLDASKISLSPGDTLCIEGGLRRNLQIKNVHGDSLNPVTIINQDEVIISNTDFYYGFKLVDCSYFQLTGTGNEEFEYGIKVLGTGNGANGVSISGKSSDFEVDHIEVASTGFAGIMSKADPRCDSSVNRDFFVQKNLSFHHNYIHDVGGEGFYVGNSFYSGYDRNKNCPGDTLYPHEIKGLRIYENQIFNTGWEGLQIGCATEDVVVFNNYIKNYGTENKPMQNNGMQIGEGSTGVYYNNIITEGPGNGIIILGLGNTVVYNNFIGKCSHSGIFCDNRVTKDSSLIAVLNNTVSNYGENSFRWYNEKTRNVFKNNLIVDPKADSTSFYFLPDSLNHQSEHNKQLTGLNLEGLKRSEKNVILISRDCMLYNAGADVSEYLSEHDIPKHRHIGAYFE